MAEVTEQQDELSVRRLLFRNSTDWQTGWRIRKHPWRNPLPCIKKEWRLLKYCSE